MQILLLSLHQCYIIKCASFPQLHEFTVEIYPFMHIEISNNYCILPIYVYIYTLVSLRFPTVSYFYRTYKQCCVSGSVSSLFMQCCKRYNVCLAKESPSPSHFQ